MRRSESEPYTQSAAVQRFHCLIPFSAQLLDNNLQVIHEIFGAGLCQG
jgi:hypothetical protein